MNTQRELENLSKGIILNYSFQIGNKILSSPCPRLHIRVNEGEEWEKECTVEEIMDSVNMWTPYAKYRLENMWHYYTIYDEE